MPVQRMPRKMTPWPSMEVVGLAWQAIHHPFQSKIWSPVKIRKGCEALSRHDLKHGSNDSCLGPLERTVLQADVKGKGRSCSVYRVVAGLPLQCRNAMFSPLQACLSPERPGLGDRELQLVLTPSPFH